MRSSRGVSGLELRAGLGCRNMFEGHWVGHPKPGGWRDHPGVGGGRWRTGSRARSGLDLGGASGELDALGWGRGTPEPGVWPPVGTLVLTLPRAAAVEGGREKEGWGGPSRLLGVCCEGSRAREGWNPGHACKHGLCHQTGRQGWWEGQQPGQRRAVGRRLWHRGWGLALQTTLHPQGCCRKQFHQPRWSGCWGRGDGVWAGEMGQIWMWLVGAASRSSSGSAGQVWAGQKVDLTSGVQWGKGSCSGRGGPCGHSG